jgi:hypothetical protein
VRENGEMEAARRARERHTLGCLGGQGSYGAEPGRSTDGDLGGDGRRQKM